MMDLAFNFEEEKTMPAEAAAEGPQPKTVTELSNEIKRFVEGNFGRVLVRGEIFGAKRADSGHWYLSLKDENAVLSAVCWRGVASGLKVKIEDGLEVIASGKITTFSGKSSYQLVIESLEPAGQGALLKLLEERKQQFIKEGLFDTAHKKPIPFLPRTIGVVSSASGAVIRDIIHRIRDRFPSHIVLWPTPVQGEGAAQSIVNGIHAMEQLHPDLLIVGRGGGSIEDLWAFNEEIVARAIFDCPIPVISAVGHETDTTIADYVADLRAPTPSAAAELAVFDIQDFYGNIGQYRMQMNRLMKAKLDIRKQKQEYLKRQLLLLSPQSRIHTKRQYAADLEERLRQQMKQQIIEARHQMEIFAGTLDGLSPAKKLMQGYSVAVNDAGRNIRSTKDVQPGEDIVIRVTDGAVLAKVTGIKEQIRWEKN